MIYRPDRHLSHLNSISCALERDVINCAKFAAILGKRVVPFAVVDGGWFAVILSEIPVKVDEHVRAINVTIDDLDSKESIAIDHLDGNLLQRITIRI